MDETTLLLVEDEYFIGLSERRRLEAAGYSVIFVQDGEGAVKAAVEGGGRIALAILDIDLGLGMNGVEAARAIVDSTGMPVVFLSSHGDRESVELAETVPNYGYVVKESNSAVLLAAVRMALRLHAANEAVRRRERSLADSQLQMRSVIEHSRGAIAFLDRELRFVLAGRRFLADFGLGELDLVGKSLERSFPAGYAAWRSACGKALEGQHVSATTAFELATGGGVEVAWDCRPWYSSDGTIAGVAFYCEPRAAETGPSLAEHWKVRPNRYDPGAWLGQGGRERRPLAGWAR